MDCILTWPVVFSCRCFNEETCISVPEVEGYVMVLQPEEPKISLSGIDHFARGAAEFESPEGVTLFPELRIVSTITREVEAEAETTEGPEDDPTGMGMDLTLLTLDLTQLTLDLTQLTLDLTRLTLDLTQLTLDLTRSTLDLTQITLALT